MFLKKYKFYRNAMESGQIIKEIRTKHGLTQNEFAERLSISRSALTQLEAGNTKPSFEVIRVLTEAFDVDPVRFFPPKKSGKRIGAEVTAANVQGILDFYRQHYGIQYNEVMEDRMIDIFLELESDTKRVEALRNVYRIYRAVSRITEKLERDFMDPLKRHLNTVKTLKKINEEGLAEELNKEVTESSEQLNFNLQIIYRDALLFMSMYGNKLSDLPDLLTKHQIELVRKDSEHQKIMKYSEEKYLNAFLYLLKHAKDLEQVEEYFDIESYWRE